MFKWLFREKAAKGAGQAPGVGTSPPPVTTTGSAGTLQELMGVALRHHQAGNLQQAGAIYDQILATDPGNSDALHLLGVVAYQTGRYDEAADLISRALARNAAYAPAHNNLGNVYRAQRKNDQALACFRKAVALDPNYLDAHVSQGALLRSIGMRTEALSCYQRARSLNPDLPITHLNLGGLLEEMGKTDEAIDAYRQALVLKPDFPQAQFGLGNSLKGLGRLDEAVACYRRTIELLPDFHAAYTNLGNALNEQGKPAEAIASYERALALKPDLFDARFNLGNVLKDGGRLDEAIACYRNALELKPDFAEAHYFLGNALREQDRTAEVAECYRRALALAPEYAEARWALTMSQLPAVCDVDTEPEACRAVFSLELERLENWFDSARIALGHRAVGVQQPFCLAYTEQDNRDLMRRYGNLCCRIMRDWYQREGLSVPGASRPDGVIRVGVVSQYFLDHSVWNAIVKGWFLHLDRSRFSLHAFYVGTAEDRETQFARRHASRFEQGPKGLESWVESIVGRQLDVLIYPEIGMDPMTLRLASLRLAPVQIAAWGHPETTGLATIDYYLSAEDMEPPEGRSNYTERLVTLPHLGCCYQPAVVEAVAPDLLRLGLDPQSPLLLCCGVPFKYAPEHDWLLTEIATRLGRCQFVFFTYRLDKLSMKLARRLETTFARRELDFHRHVKFIPWQNSAGYHGLLKRADVFLDTVGFSGFNTAMQALECGLPVVTREGRFLRGRLASGILRRMGLPELVTKTSEDYVDLAVRLAQDAEFSMRIRGRIDSSRDVLVGDIAPIRAMEEFLAGLNS